MRIQLANCVTLDHVGRNRKTVGGVIFSKLEDSLVVCNSVRLLHLRQLKRADGCIEPVNHNLCKGVKFAVMLV